MIIRRQYSGDKEIEGNYISTQVKGRAKRSILNDALVCDIITFDYNRKGRPVMGEDHDYRPQLLILGSNSYQYSGPKRMADRITGINLHYLTQNEANSVIRQTKNLFSLRMSSPQLVTSTIGNAAYYRQYLTENISRFWSLYTLASLENVSEELEEEGSVKEYKKERNEKIIVKTTRNSIKAGADESLLDNLGFESDIYR